MRRFLTCQNVMFKGDRGAKAKAKKVVDYLTAYKDRKTHGRYINIDECKAIGLNIEDLEDWHKAAVACLVILGARLVADHWNHVASALPYLLLLACPLMHLFMHDKHHHHHDNKKEESQ